MLGVVILPDGTMGTHEFNNFGEVACFCGGCPLIDPTIEYCKLHGHIRSGLMAPAVMYCSAEAEERNPVAELLASDPTPKGVVVILRVVPALKWIGRGGWSEKQAAALISDIRKYLEHKKMSTGVGTPILKQSHI